MSVRQPSSSVTLSLQILELFGFTLAAPRVNFHPLLDPPYRGSPGVHTSTPVDSVFYLSTNALQSGAVFFSVAAPDAWYHSLLKTTLDFLNLFSLRIHDLTRFSGHKGSNKSAWSCDYPLGKPTLSRACGSRGRLTYPPCSQMRSYVQDREVGAYPMWHPEALPVGRVGDGLCGCR